MSNIVIDGNYLFYKTLFVLPRVRGKKLLESKQQQEQFIRKLAIDFSHMIRQLPSPKKIVFTVDSPSWRKEIEIVENEGYKSNRTYADDIDWNAFFECVNEFCNILSEKGVIVSKIKRAEGDDLLHLWSNYFLKNKQNVIIATGDYDMHQLARFECENYCIIYNPNSKNNKVFGPVGFKEYIEQLKNKEYTIFDVDAYKESDEIQFLEKFEVNEVNKDFLLKKILIGDKGDSVPSVFTWTSKNGSMRYSITDKKAEQILEYVREQTGNDIDVFSLVEYANYISDAIRKILKKEVDSEELQSKLERNIKLMVLHENIIPKEIIDEFELKLNELDQSQRLKGIQSMERLLEGTRYISDNKKSKGIQFDLFSALDKKTK